MNITGIILDDFEEYCKYHLQDIISLKYKFNSQNKYGNQIEINETD